MAVVLCLCLVEWGKFGPVPQVCEGITLTFYRMGSCMLALTIATSFPSSNKSAQIASCVFIYMVIALHPAAEVLSLTQEVQLLRSYRVSRCQFSLLCGGCPGQTASQHGRHINCEPLAMVGLNPPSTFHSPSHDEKQNVNIQPPPGILSSLWSHLSQSPTSATDTSSFSQSSVTVSLPLFISSILKPWARASSR